MRNGNLVTITTSITHGLQVNSIVQIGSVTDTSFNGTQQVASVPTSTTFTYNQAGSNASSGNGVVSVLIQGDWATDAVLLPFANKAYRKVQQRLFANSTQSQKTEVIITLPAGTTDLTDSTNPQLPPDFLAPITIEERISGNPFFGAPMPQVNQLPSQQQSALDGVYAWFEDGLHFIGALNSTDKRIRYEVSFPALSDGSSSLLIRGCLDAVADWTAFLAASSRGGMNAAVFSSLFADDMQDLLNLQAHGMQFRPARRRPNNLGRRGVRSFAYYKG